MTEHPADRHNVPPSIRNRRVVDIHAHWYPADWLKLFERDGPSEGAKLERKGTGYTIRTERIVNAFDEEFVDLGLRLAGMDRQRVDLHALSLTAPMVYWASPGFGLALAQAYNDAASAGHSAFSDRFVGLAMLPMQAPELAVKELERAAKLPGMRGMYLATHVNNIDLDDRRFWDVYAKAEELGVNVFTGFPAAQLLVREEAVAGVRTAAAGLDRAPGALPLLLRTAQGARDGARRGRPRRGRRRVSAALPGRSRRGRKHGADRAAAA